MNTSLSRGAVVAASTSLAIPAAISFALFSQPILVHAGETQFSTDVPSNRPFAGLSISAAVARALLAKTVLVFTSETQLLTLPAASASVVANNDAAGSDLDIRLRKRRDWKNKKCRERSDSQCKLTHSNKTFLCQDLLISKIPAKCWMPINKCQRDVEIISERCSVLAAYEAS